MSDEIVELHFIDGPLAGTRKRELMSVIVRNRTYRHLQPVPMPYSEVKVPNNNGQEWVQVVCSETHYVPIKLPRDILGANRFAMLVERDIK